MKKVLHRWSRPIRRWWRYTPREQVWGVVMCVGAALVAVAVIAVLVTR
jgi:hypothetical protein